jgi:hypothetical protein
MPPFTEEPQQAVRRKSTTIGKSQQKTIPITEEHLQLARIIQSEKTFSSEKCRGSRTCPTTTTPPTTTTTTTVTVTEDATVVSKPAEPSSLESPPPPLLNVEEIVLIHRAIQEAKLRFLSKLGDRNGVESSTMTAATILTQSRPISSVPSTGVMKPQGTEFPSSSTLVGTETTRSFSTSAASTEPSTETKITTTTTTTRLSTTPTTRKTTTTTTAEPATVTDEETEEETQMTKSTGRTKRTKPTTTAGVDEVYDESEAQTTKKRRRFKSKRPTTTTSTTPIPSTTDNGGSTVNGDEVSSSSKTDYKLRNGLLSICLYIKLSYTVY